MREFAVVVWRALVQDTEDALLNCLSRARFAHCHSLTALVTAIQAEVEREDKRNDTSQCKLRCVAIDGLSLLLSARLGENSKGWSGFGRGRKITSEANVGCPLSQRSVSDASRRDFRPWSISETFCCAEGSAHSGEEPFDRADWRDGNDIPA